MTPKHFAFDAASDASELSDPHTMSYMSAGRSVDGNNQTCVSEVASSGWESGCSESLEELNERVKAQLERSA